MIPLTFLCHYDCARSLDQSTVSRGVPGSSLIGSMFVHERNNAKETQMAPLKVTGGWTQFLDLSNTTNAVEANDVGDQMTLHSQPQFLDPKEAKRQRERERYAKMTDQQKDERNRKRREAYQRKKGSGTPQAGGHKCTIDFNEKSFNAPTSLANTSLWLTSSDEQREAKRMRERVRYANMTHEEKKLRFHRQYLQDALRRETLSQEHIEAIKERRRVHNMTPEQKQARKDREKARRVLQRKTLHKDSIAMANPMYNSSDESN
ncbi:hypothetical protein EJB05_37461, partial [Eragrostis curvula]